MLPRGCGLGHGSVVPLWVSRALHADDKDPVTTCCMKALMVRVPAGSWGTAVCRQGLCPLECFFKASSQQQEGRHPDRAHAGASHCSEWFLNVHPQAYSAQPHLFQGALLSPWVSTPAPCLPHQSTPRGGPPPCVCCLSDGSRIWVSREQSRRPCSCVLPSPWER